MGAKMRGGGGGGGLEDTINTLFFVVAAPKKYLATESFFGRRFNKGVKIFLTH